MPFWKHKLEKEALYEAQRAIDHRGPRWYFTPRRWIAAFIALTSWIAVIGALRSDRLYFGSLLGGIERGAHPSAFSLSALALCGLGSFFFLLTVARRAP